MPKGADNTTSILDAARELFLDGGYAPTSMDAVATRAGVSKATVYATFASKADLFAAMVDREGSARIVDLNRHPEWTTAEVLHAFARDAADLLLSESVIAMHRLIAAETNRAPEVGSLFFFNGPQRLIDGLTDYLDAAMQRGDLRTGPARLAATQFLQIIVGDLQLRSLMRVPIEMSDGELELVVRSGVEMFLRGYAPIERPL